ncbi:FeoA family protein [Schaalia vaccimaxillae]|uniref:FeoA family protein n=1 Tax=Schaalia vaccimaxillae TaxID=183916 RepID=UPI0003B3114E|nr:FeoA family protein [Schaalia vaccimaxillae]
MTLSQFPINERGRILGVNVDSTYQLRLHELGLRTGAEFYLVNRAAFGGVVINIAGARIAVDTGSARSIIVEALA